MGAWGHGPFDNDGALDWVSWAEDDTNAAIDSALEQATGAAYLDVDQGSAAVAAAALIAAARDGDMAGLPEDVAALAQDWQPDDTHAARALAALAAVVGAQSELASLWREGTTAAAWEATIERLRERLLRSPPG
ncbi:DUF4259 domain-containing protein [Pendulispora brunnea]|uniref:DUF4259 domain-containing protein n=1 Tax=Pendulispora brunnea TaxID=2905690 RepID=A0ABZ2KT15_9BACT